MRNINNALSVIDCDSYNINEVREALIKLMQPLGGISNFVKSGDTVLLKPNMLTCRAPDSCATTNPAIVEAVSQMCIEIGAKVLIGDSPPIVFGKTDKYWKITGFEEVAKRTGAKLLCFENDETRLIKIKTNGKLISVSIIKSLFDVDVVISLPKMKTHNLTRITGAVKNFYGLIPGLEKSKWHSIFPKSLEFGNFIADFTSKIPHHLNIMDAIDAMEGQGPAGGETIHPALLLASVHPVSIDLAFCKIANISPDTVSVLTRCKEINFGPKSLDEIEIYGELKKLDSYNVPATAYFNKIPDFAMKVFRQLIWSGPKLTGNCIKCGRCVKVCPADAISISSGEATFCRTKCVSCFCCMEVCPQDAIEMRISPLLSIGKKVKKLIENKKN